MNHYCELSSSCRLPKLLPLLNLISRLSADFGVGYTLAGVGGKIDEFLKTLFVRMWKNLKRLVTQMTWVGGETAQWDLLRTTLWFAVFSNFFYLSTEGACVFSMLGDFHLLDGFTQGGTIAGTIFTNNSNLLCPLCLEQNKQIRDMTFNIGGEGTGQNNWK